MACSYELKNCYLCPRTPVTHLSGQNSPHRHCGSLCESHFDLQHGTNGDRGRSPLPHWNGFAASPNLTMNLMEGHEHKWLKLPAKESREALHPQETSGKESS